MVAISKIRTRHRLMRMTMTRNRQTDTYIADRPWMSHPGSPNRTACRLISIEYNHSLYDPVGTLHHHTDREHAPWLRYVPITQPAFTTPLIVMIS